MLSSDRSRLVRPVLLALGCGWLLASGGCGGAATGELGGSLDGDGGSSGGTSTGGSAGVGGTGRGASGGSDPGGAGGGGGASGSFGGGVGFGGGGGASGSASTGVGGSSAGSAGAAGSGSLPGPSVCVDLSSGLAGLPSQAFPAPDDMVDEYCGPGLPNDQVYQAICLPAPGNGQSCTSFYPDYLITQLYQCGAQGSANFLCGPHEPLPDTDGCRGNECCYVLVGDCN